MKRNTADIGIDQQEDDMDISRAKELFRSLADGVDPFTGELLPDDSVCSRADVVRAFHCILETLDKQPQEKKLPENAGKPWTEEDEKILGNMFDHGCSSKDMQAYFHRTRGAIAARLVHLGKIESRDQFNRE